MFLSSKQVHQLSETFNFVANFCILSVIYRAFHLCKIWHCVAVRTQQLRHCLTTQVAPEPLTNGTRKKRDYTSPFISFFLSTPDRPVSSICYCDLLNRLFQLDRGEFNAHWQHWFNGLTEKIGKWTDGTHHLQLYQQQREF